MNPKETIYIGISLGFCPSKETYKSTELIDQSIDCLISKLHSIGYDVFKLNPRFDYVFILDSENKNIIVPSYENKEKQYNRKLT